MRVLVMGSGGVGGYYGGTLAQRGHDVTFVARGAHLAAMRERGLELRVLGETTLLHPVSAVGEPAQADGSVDLVLFTVKTYDTAGAAEALRAVVGPGTSILPLQNGVDSVDELSAALGAEHILGGTTQIGARIVEPGVVERFSPFCEITLGEPGGGLSARAETFAAALQDAGLKAIASSDVQRALWEKFMLLAPLASLTSACRVPSGQVRGVPETGALFRALRSEVVAVGRASGVNLPEASVESVEQFFIGLPEIHMTSMQRDFEDQRRVELEQVTGAVVRRGRKLGVPTPGFDVVYAILRTRALSYGGVS